MQVAQEARSKSGIVLGGNAAVMPCSAPANPRPTPRTNGRAERRLGPYLSAFAMLRCSVTVGISPFANVLRASLSPDAA